MSGLSSATETAESYRKPGARPGGKRATSRQRPAGPGLTARRIRRAAERAQARAAVRFDGVREALRIELGILPGAREVYAAHLAAKEAGQ